MSKLFGRKIDSNALDGDTAEQILANVYSCCNKQPNTVPLETLISYSNYRQERFTFQRSVIAVVLALFLILPFCFVVPTVVANLISGADEAPRYEVSVTTDSFIRIPIRQVLARLQGHNVPMNKVEEDTYVVTPRANGEMTVTVTLANRQRASLDLKITNVDEEAPVITSVEMAAGLVRLYVTDEESGVNFDKAYTEGPDGRRHPPMEIDRENGVITIAYPTEETRVCVFDTTDNKLMVVLRPSADDNRT